MSQTFEELDMLAAALQAAASKVRRAAALLKAAGDLDVLEKRLRSLIPIGRPAIAADEGSGPRTAVASPGATNSSVRLGSVPLLARGPGACAVFDQDSVRGRNDVNQLAVGQNNKQVRKTTAQDRVQCVRREVRDIDVVPF